MKTILAVSCILAASKALIVMVTEPHPPVASGDLLSFKLMVAAMVLSIMYATYLMSRKPAIIYRIERP